MNKIILEDAYEVDVGNAKKRARLVTLAAKLTKRQENKSRMRVLMHFVWIIDLNQGCEIEENEPL